MSNEGQSLCGVARTSVHQRTIHHLSHCSPVRACLREGHLHHHDAVELLLWINPEESAPCACPEGIANRAGDWRVPRVCAHGKAEPEALTKVRRGREFLRGIDRSDTR